MAQSQDDVLRVTAKMSLGVEDVQNVYHFIVGGTGTATDAATLTAIANLLDDAYFELQGSTSDEISFDTIEVYNLTQDTWVGELVWPSLTTGGQTGNLMPPQTSMLALFNTDTLRSQGRKFLPPSVIDYVGADGTPLSGVLGYAANFATELLLGATSGTVTFKPGNFRALLSAFIPWVFATIPDFYATQRRRYYGKGS